MALFLQRLHFWITVTTQFLVAYAMYIIVQSSLSFLAKLLLSVTCNIFAILVFNFVGQSMDLVLMATYLTTKVLSAVLTYSVSSVYSQITHVGG
jgi:hypothetical protein